MTLTGGERAQDLARTAVLTASARSSACRHSAWDPGRRGSRVGGGEVAERVQNHLQCFLVLAGVAIGFTSLPGTVWPTTIF